MCSVSIMLNWDQTWLNWAQTGLNWPHTGLIRGSNWAQLGSNWPQLGSSRLKLGSTGFNWALPGSIGLNWALLCLTELNIAKYNIFEKMRNNMKSLFLKRIALRALKNKRKRRKYYWIDCHIVIIFSKNFVKSFSLKIPLTGFRGICFK